MNGLEAQMQKNSPTALESSLEKRPQEWNPAKDLTLCIRLVEEGIPCSPSGGGDALGVRFLPAEDLGCERCAPPAVPAGAILEAGLSSVPARVLMHAAETVSRRFRRADGQAGSGRPSEHFSPTTPRHTERGSACRHAWSRCARSDSGAPIGELRFTRPGKKPIQSMSANI